MLHRMRDTGRPLVVTLSIGASIALGSSSAAAAAPAAWVHTGDGVMRTHVAFVPVDVFAVGHDMKGLPQHKSKADVILAECDKRFVWRALRDVDKGDVRDSLREAYRAVDYHDAAKIERALSIFTSTIKEGGYVTISYDAASQRTTFTQGRGGAVDIAGLGFMKATWGLVFANHDTSELGAALLKKL